MLIRYQAGYKRVDACLFSMSLLMCFFYSYCTPGFVMGMNAYLNHTPLEQRTLVDIENLFDGHCK